MSASSTCSARRAAANRANAQRSTGPKTPAGKHASSSLQNKPICQNGSSSHSPVVGPRKNAITSATSCADNADSNPCGISDRSVLVSDFSPDRGIE